MGTAARILKISLHLPNSPHWPRGVDGRDLVSAVEASLIPIAVLGEVPLGTKLGRTVAGVRVLLVNAGNGIQAYEDRCSHRDVRLCEGNLEGRVLTCRAHEWRYDADTGCAIAHPGVRLRRYGVRIEAARILVDIGGSP